MASRLRPLLSGRIQHAPNCGHHFGGKSFYFYRISCMNPIFAPAGKLGQKVTRNGGSQFGACLTLSDFDIPSAPIFNQIDSQNKFSDHVTHRMTGNTFLTCFCRSCNSLTGIALRPLKASAIVPSKPYCLSTTSPPQDDFKKSTETSKLSLSHTHAQRWRGQDMKHKAELAAI